MNKLSHNWKQQKPFRTLTAKENLASSTMQPTTSSGQRRRFMGRIAVSQKHGQNHIAPGKSSSTTPQIHTGKENEATEDKNKVIKENKVVHRQISGNDTMNSTFGGDFDDDFFTAMDMIEKDYQNKGVEGELTNSSSSDSKLYQAKRTDTHLSECNKIVPNAKRDGFTSNSSKLRSVTYVENSDENTRQMNPMLLSKHCKEKTELMREHKHQESVSKNDLKDINSDRSVFKSPTSQIIRNPTRKRQEYIEYLNGVCDVTFTSPMYASTPLETTRTKDRDRSQAILKPQKSQLSVDPSLKRKANFFRDILDDSGELLDASLKTVHAADNKSDVSCHTDGNVEGNNENDQNTRFASATETGVAIETEGSKKTIDYKPCQKLTNSDENNPQTNLLEAGTSGVVPKTSPCYHGEIVQEKYDSKMNVTLSEAGSPVEKKNSNCSENSRKQLKTVTKCSSMPSTVQDEESQGFDTSDLSEAVGGDKESSPAPVSAMPGVADVLVQSRENEADRLQLASWGLPECVLRQYKQKRVTTMFEWQAECLCTGHVLAGGNLVYSAPTSAGKTMVAELLMLKQVVETKKKAIFILPFVSLAREKMHYLQEMFQDAGVRVDGFMGNWNASGGFNKVDIAVCTIEKANSLVNRLLEDGRIDQLGLVVVDELHMVGDSHRGYLLELLLTKIRYVSAKSAPKSESGSVANPVQIIGMSATLPNLDLLAVWLEADLYTTDFRPVPLTETFKVGAELFDCNMKKIREIDPSKAFKGDEEHIIPLCLETILDKNSVLIFCPTKNWCEKLSETIAREFYRLNRELKTRESGFVKASALVTVPIDQQGLRDVIEQLRRTPVGLDAMLGRVVPYGVAFHHAGLTFDERDIVEGAFRLGVIRVLVATSTLSSGVNLPARRVIVRTPIFHGTIIDTRTYKQMVGRAGRKGVDTIGESILVCKANEKSKAMQLVKSQLQPIKSCLIRNSVDGLSSSMKRAILEVVVSGVASTPLDVDTYAKCTLLASSMAEEEKSGTSNDTDHLPQSDPVKACIAFLKESEFITLKKVMEKDVGEVERFFPTQLGSAVLSSAFSPDEGLAVFSELQKARRCFVLENELHTVYLVTPIYMQDQWATLDWYQYLCQWEQLSSGMKRVAELVGVKESFLTKAVRGRIPSKTSDQLRLLNIHKRFYTCLVLHDLVNEKPLAEVARKYNCTRGMLQSLQQSAATFAGMVTVFCSRLGWINLELLLSQFQSRLTFGVQRELVDLVRLSLMNAQRARIMYNAGYQTVASLATADPVDIENLLKNATPFQSKKKARDESEWEAEERKKLRCIWLTGQKGLTEEEAALLIIDEAKQLLKQDVGELGIEWKPTITDKDQAEEDRKSKRNRSSTSGRMKSPLEILRRRRASSNSSSQNNKSTSKLGSPKFAQGLGTSILSPPPSMRLSMLKSPLQDKAVNSTCSHSTVKPKTAVQSNIVTRNAGAEVNLQSNNPTNPPISKDSNIGLQGSKCRQSKELECKSTLEELNRQRLGKENVPNSAQNHIVKKEALLSIERVEIEYKNLQQKDNKDEKFGRQGDKTKRCSSPSVVIGQAKKSSVNNSHQKGKPVLSAKENMNNSIETDEMTIQHAVETVLKDTQIPMGGYLHKTASTSKGQQKGEPIFLNNGSVIPDPSCSISTVKNMGAVMPTTHHQTKRRLQSPASRSRDQLPETPETLQSPIRKKTIIGEGKRDNTDRKQSLSPDILTPRRSQRIKNGSRKSSLPHTETLLRTPVRTLSSRDTKNTPKSRSKCKKPVATSIATVLDKNIEIEGLNSIASFMANLAPVDVNVISAEESGKTICLVQPQGNEDIGSSKVRPNKSDLAETSDSSDGFGDSFMLDTQTLKLVANFTPSSYDSNQAIEKPVCSRIDVKHNDARAALGDGSIELYTEDDHCKDDKIVTDMNEHNSNSSHSGAEEYNDSTDIAEKNISDDSIDIGEQNISVDLTDIAEKNISDDSINIAEKNTSDDSTDIPENNISDDSSDIAEKNILDDSTDIAEKNISVEHSDLDLACSSRGIIEQSASPFLKSNTKNDINPEPHFQFEQQDDTGSELLPASDYDRLNLCDQRVPYSEDGLFNDDEINCEVESDCHPPFQNLISDHQSEDNPVCQAPRTNADMGSKHTDKTTPVRCLQYETTPHTNKIGNRSSNLCNENTGSVEKMCNNRDVVLSEHLREDLEFAMNMSTTPASFQNVQNSSVPEQLNGNIPSLGLSGNSLSDSILQNFLSESGFDKGTTFDPNMCQDKVETKETAVLDEVVYKPVPSTSKNSEKHHASKRTINKLSPGTESILSDLCDQPKMSSRKAAPKRKDKRGQLSGGNPSAADEGSYSKTKRKVERCDTNGVHSDLTHVVNSPVAKSKGKRLKSAPWKGVKRSVGNYNNSEVSPPKQQRTRATDDHKTAECGSRDNSDCVPPTPPDKTQVQKPDTPSRLIGGVTPKRPLSITGKTPKEHSQQGKSKGKKIGKSQNIDPIINTGSAQIDEDCTTSTRSNSNSDDEGFTIFDVAADKRLFLHFIEEWKTKTSYAFSIACEKLPQQEPDAGGIGANFKKGGKRMEKPQELVSVSDFVLEQSQKQVVGVAVAWEDRDAYYVALTQSNSKCSLDDSLTPPPLDDTLSVKDKLFAIQSVLEMQQTTSGQDIMKQGFDMMELYKSLCQGCGVQLHGEVQDPKVAEWLLDPGANEKNLHRMVISYLPDHVHLLEGIGGGIGLSSIGLTPENPGSGRVRSCIESVLVCQLMTYFRLKLEEEDLWRSFSQVEMPSQITLARMDLNGMGFSDSECESQKSIMLAKLSALEEQAYHLAGHHFSLSSPEDISQVLFLELKLPPSGDPSNPTVTKTLGPARRATGRGRVKQQFSTSKDILEKLKEQHAMPGLILEWRRISAALSKVVFPLQKEKCNSQRLGMYRIYAICQTHTATGRVSFQEPNLQNIPKDFQIEMPALICESPQDSTSVPQRNARGRSKKTLVVPHGMARCLPDQAGPAFSVSMRHAFLPFQGGVMLSADYSQLELRVIAHLSKDRKLIQVLNSGSDVFKSIAAQCQNIAADDVTPEQRQQAKGVCYGMIYGMGAKSLGDQLGVDENEAAVFIETFKAKYTGMRTYLRETVQRCKEMGYVETIHGRRRYLPGIKDTNTYKRAHAERQAVNTSVQGSAADLVKAAMVGIDRKLMQVFPECNRTHRHRLDSIDSHRRSPRTRRKTPTGGYLVLQLHDELIYEVNRKDVSQVAQIVKTMMEETTKLNVRLPVKARVGPTWASLEDLDL